MSGEVKLSNLLGMAATAESGGNNEEALSYYNRTLEADPQCSEAWIGKGRVAGRLSSLANLRVSEMLICFGHAIATADEASKGAVGAQAQAETVALCSALYGVAERHLQQFQSADAARVSFINVACALSDALEQAEKMAPAATALLIEKTRITKGVLDFGVGAELASILKDRRDRAIESLAIVSPDYRAPALADETLVQSEQRKAEFDAIGYVVLIIVVILGAIITAAIR